MTENYPDAALRHWQDAELLKGESRIDNADHHYGFAAECAVKTALVSLPAFAVAEVLDKSYHEHINLLWDKVGHQSLQKRYPCLYAALKLSNPFANWNVSHRYAANGMITSADLEQHRKSAQRLFGCVGLQGARQS